MPDFGMEGMHTDECIDNHVRFVDIIIEYELDNGDNGSVRVLQAPADEGEDYADEDEEEPETREIGIGDLPNCNQCGVDSTECALEEFAAQII